MAEQLRCPVEGRRAVVEHPESGIEQPLHVVRAPDQRIADPVAAGRRNDLIDQRPHAGGRPQWPERAGEEVLGGRRVRLRTVLEDRAVTAGEEQRDSHSTTNRDSASAEALQALNHPGV
jgi:hypothetical protein